MTSPTITYSEIALKFAILCKCLVKVLKVKFLWTAALSDSEFKVAVLFSFPCRQSNILHGGTFVAAVNTFWIFVPWCMHECTNVFYNLCHTWWSHVRIQRIWTKIAAFSGVPLCVRRLFVLPISHLGITGTYFTLRCHFCKTLVLSRSDPLFVCLLAQNHRHFCEFL